MGKETAFEVGRLYLQLKRIADVLTASTRDVFIGLPGLVGYWPMGIKFLNGTVVEHGGTLFSLSETGVCPAGDDGNAFTHVGNGVNFLSSAGSLGVTGLETSISSSIRGLTFGGWFMIDGLPPSQAGFITKFGVVTNYGYALAVLSTGVIQVTISSNGSATTAVSSPAVGLGEWLFLAARFTPSAELAVFVSGDKTVNTASIPASVNVSTQTFEVGRYANDNSFIANAKARDVFICASALSDARLEEIRSASAP